MDNNIIMIKKSSAILNFRNLNGYKLGVNFIFLKNKNNNQKAR